MDDGVFEVQSESQREQFYEVHLEPPSCMCVGFCYRRFCKHTVAAKQYAESAIQLQDGGRVEEYGECSGAILLPPFASRLRRGSSQPSPSSVALCSGRDRARTFAA